MHCNTVFYYVHYYIPNVQWYINTYFCIIIFKYVNLRSNYEKNPRLSVWPKLFLPRVLGRSWQWGVQARRGWGRRRAGEGLCIGAQWGHAMYLAPKCANLCGLKHSMMRSYEFPLFLPFMDQILFFVVFRDNLR